MPRTFGLPHCAAFLGCLTACEASGPGSGGARTTFDTVAGVEWVRNVGAPEEWRVTELLTLGSVGGADGAKDDEFGRITGVIADDMGNVYVADANAMEIRVFDPAGALQRRIGRRGSGPGEFQRLQSIGWMGDTLAALDAGNGRLALLDANGAWLGHRPFMALSGSSIRLFVTGADELYMPFIARVGDRAQLVYVRQTPAGAGDSLSADAKKPGSTAESELHQRKRSQFVTCQHSAGQGISTYAAELAPRMILVPAPHAMRALVWSSEYRIAFLNAVGDTMRVVERDIPVSALTEDEWRKEEQDYQKFLDEYPDETCEPRSLPRPTQRQLILGIFFDDAGRMWVERDVSPGRAFDVFDAAGRLLGSVTSPVRLERVPPYIRGDQLYIVVTDSLDVEHVKAFRSVR